MTAVYTLYHHTQQEQKTNKKYKNIFNHLLKNKLTFLLQIFYHVMTEFGKTGFSQKV